MPNSAEFGRFRSFVWPIHQSEIRQYLPIFLVTLLLGIDYHVLRTLKYSLLVLAPEAGAEAIPFVQLWGLLPGALLMTWFLAGLCRRLSQAQVFYLTTSLFLVFFFIFQFVLYPIREMLEPTSFVKWLSLRVPASLGGCVAVIRHWVLSLFFVVSELWKVSVLAVLFWGFVNTSLPLDKATRFYGPLMLASSLAGLLGGAIAGYFPQAAWVQRIGIGESSWQRSLSVMMVVVILVGILAMAVFRYLERHTVVVRNPGSKEPEKRGFSVREAIRCMRKSRYLLSIGLIVALEYVSFGLGEILWKDQLKNYLPDQNAFTAYTGKVVLLASLLSLLGSQTLSGAVIKRLGWRIAALIAPCVLLLTSVAFYLFVLFPDSHLTIGSAALFGVTPLAAAVFLGATHNCLCRVAKNMFVDPTKELAFVPLDSATQLKGKAIIDGIGTHAGRGGGALVQQLLLVTCSTVIAGAPVSFLVVLVAGGLWVVSADYVGRRYSGLAEGTLSPTEVAGTASG